MCSLLRFVSNSLKNMMMMMTTISEHCKTKLNHANRGLVRICCRGRGSLNQNFLVSTFQKITSQKSDKKSNIHMLFLIIFGTNFLSSFVCLIFLFSRFDSRLVFQMLLFVIVTYLFHSRLETYLFHESFHILLPTELHFTDFWPSTNLFSVHFPSIFIGRQHSLLCRALYWLYGRDVCLSVCLPVLLSVC